jgi:hypothetical protein
MVKSKEYDIVEVCWIDAEEFGEVGWNAYRWVLSTRW